MSSQSYFTSHLVKGRHVAVIATCLLVLISNLASAQNNVRLEGAIVAGTCSVSDVTEPMTKVPVELLPAVAGGVPQSYTPFVIALRNCAGVKTAKMTFGSTADRHDSVRDTFANKSADGARNVSIWIQARADCTRSGSGISPGHTRSANINSAESFDYPVCAQYWRSGVESVRSGDVSTTFTLSIAYE